MPKRKTTAEEVPAQDAKMRDGDESSSSDDEDMVDVDFEWFDPDPEIDFHGLKTLLRQLFDVDNQLFDLSALADLILSQPSLGSTVKVDGKESDPFAFLTVLNMREHKDKQVIKDLSAYLCRKSNDTPSLSTLPTLLAPNSSAEVGLILTERFINMPSEVVTPMYTMLSEEITWALEDKKPYNFTHYLIVSKTYTEVESKLDAEDNRPKKKGKQQQAVGGGGGGGVVDAQTWFFHPEDEKVHEFCVGWGNFEHDFFAGEEASDAKRAFQEAGIRPMGHLMLVERERFADAIKGIDVDGRSKMEFMHY